MPRSVVFERAGVIRCQSNTAQFDYAHALATQPLPQGLRVAIVCNAGGPGIMATDAAERQGLELAPFSEETIQKLQSKLPAAANVRNPVDVMGTVLRNGDILWLGAPGDDDVVMLQCVLPRRPVAEPAPVTVPAVAPVRPTPEVETVALWAVGDEPPSHSPADIATEAGPR